MSRQPGFFDLDDRYALLSTSDDQAEHQIRDRLTFMRFLGLGL